MKILLDVNDHKAAFLLELLKNFKFVKATPISSSKADLIQEFQEAVEEVNLAKEGKLKTRNAEDLINELK